MVNGVLIVLILCVLYILWKLTDRVHNKPNAVRYYYNYIVYCWATLLSSILMIPVCFARPKNVLNAKLGANIIKYLTKKLIRDVDFQLRNGEILAEERGAVIIANHQSILDVLGLFHIWNTINKMAAISKVQLFYLWPFGLSAYLSGVVFINRTNNKKSYEQFDETIKVIMKDKTKMFIFPEGTRNNRNKSILPFKKGAFNTAVKAQVPIIPIVYSPYYFIDSKKYIFNKGRIIIQCLDPVPTAGLTMDDVPQLSEKLHKIISDAFQKISEEVLEGLPLEYHKNGLNQ